MKKIYNAIFILVFCLMMGACTAKIPFTKWTHSGKISGTIWYSPDTDSPSVIPLLVRAEWKNSSAQEGHLALLFLHGSLFAECHYTDAQFVCETESSFPGAAAMANDSAMLVSAAINDVQGTLMPLDFPWNLTIESKQNVAKQNVAQKALSDKTLPRTYSAQDGKTSITFEIVEATWR